ncbi:hypothetical protein N2152v2_007015 [Parachlorella kessleri]
MAEADANGSSKEEFEGGEVLVCGATDWALVGRSKDVRAEKYPNLDVPTRIKSLEGVKVKFIAAGSAACHSIIGDSSGLCYTWGRNEKGQLGTGDLFQRNIPTVVEGLRGKKIVGGAAGRHHSVVYTATGESFAWGGNSFGQCGTGSVKKVKGGEDNILTPTMAIVSKCSGVSCGGEFTAWLCEGKLYSAGLPQYGQLGHGTDNQYNAADSSVKMVFDPQPQPRLIATLAEKEVTRFACGQNHTIAVCSDGGVWTWGFGGYGRLGHSVQQDEMRPRLVETLTGRIKVPADAQVAAGSTSTFCTILGGQLYAWGKLKPSGDNIMYPKPLFEIAGWNIKSITCGSTTFGVAATAPDGDISTITWGHSNGYSELGYGPKGKKSSANPDKCMALEGVKCYQVAMGFAHSLFLVDPTSEKVKAMPEWECEPVDEEGPPSAAGAKGKASGAKRKAPAAKAGSKGKQKK